MEVVELQSKAKITEGFDQLFFDEIQRCEKCNLCSLPVNTIKHKTAGAGYVDSDFVIVGIGTSFYRMEENTKWGGTPFGIFAEEIGEEKSNIVGVSIPLKRLIEELKLERFYVTNLMKCSTENDDDPTLDQREECAEWLRKEIEEINPKIVICLGAVFKKFLRINYGDSKEVDGTIYFLLYHPGYIARSGKFHLYEEAAEKILEQAERLKARLK